TFVYYPDGTVLLKSRLRASGRLLELLQYFGRAVLGTELAEDCLADAFHLDPLKQEFQPLPDAEDMELVRIRSLQVRYQERQGRRQVKLKTLLSDSPAAVGELVFAHLPAGKLLNRLQVSYAELQVRLQSEGIRRNVLIRLWPNRCNVSPTLLGERLRACLK